MRFNPVFRIALFPLTFISLGAMADQPPAPEALKRLLATINDRLQLADLVALSKWDRTSPVHDGEREAQVLIAAQQQADGYALAREDAEQLMVDQIEANKLVQYGLLATWRSKGHPPETERSDLETQIRPRLDGLQVQLLAQYARFSPFKTHPACAEWLDETRAQLASDVLHETALVRATGELCTDSPAVPRSAPGRSALPLPPCLIYRTGEPRLFM